MSKNRKIVKIMKRNFVHMHVCVSKAVFVPHPARRFQCVRLACTEK